jgi:hypothetical protein|tara:strand:+ start:53 stop:328 length:276 start_codon:yes stop_codon:yes gene_type:complete
MAYYDGELTMAKKLLLVVVVASFVSLGGGLSAYAADSTAKKAENPNETVCKRVRDSGTRIPRRVCLKRREWLRMAEEVKKTGQYVEPDKKN